MTAIVEALVAYLKADAGVAALVGTDVYPVELPKDKVPDMPLEAIIVRAEGGESNTGTGPIIRLTVQIESTGGKYYQAGQVDEAAFSALRDLHRDVASGLLLHSALPGQPTQARAAVTGWPVVVRSATVISDNGID